ncbi:MAG: hypothetical protein ACXAC7_04235 [Candidatus Hodarchaeales archaeon]|jgi:hypothetical protein
MIIHHTLKNAKSFRKNDRNSILPIIIQGYIIEISSEQKLRRREYIVLEIVDDTDHATIQVWGSPLKNHKIDFINEICKKGDKITIIEPRKPNTTWLRKGIDFWVSSQIPPIGTDLSGFMEWFNQKSCNLTSPASIYKNQKIINKKATKINHKEGRYSLDLQTADALLNVSMSSKKKTQSKLSYEVETKTEIKISDYQFLKYDTNEFNKDSTGDWCTIWTFKNVNKFLGQAIIYRKTINNEKWHSVMLIKAFSQKKFDKLKSNITIFYDMSFIQKLLDSNSDKLKLQKQ